MEFIDELIEAFLQGDHELTYRFNIKTKEILLDSLESDDDAAELLVKVPQITSTEAYDLMVRFANDQDASIADQLLDVLNGRKPFRSFKDKLGEQGIGDKWYEFENDYARTKMVEWLEQIQQHDAK